jgi:DNA-binding HxlR family transcriptional regulator
MARIPYTLMTARPDSPAGAGLATPQLHPEKPSMASALRKSRTAADPNCAIVHQVLSRIGDRWTLPILGSLKDGPLRFSQIERSVEGISQRMLMRTLSVLEYDGLMARTVLCTRPLRVRYQLTATGESLLIELEDLVHWIHANRGSIELARQQQEPAKSHRPAGGIPSPTPNHVPTDLSSG